MEGCLVTTVSQLSERSFVFSFATEGESKKGIGDKVPEEMKDWRSPKTAATEDI